MLQIVELCARTYQNNRKKNKERNERNGRSVATRVANVALEEAAAICTAPFTVRLLWFPLGVFVRSCLYSVSALSMDRSGRYIAYIPGVPAYPALLTYHVTALPARRCNRSEDHVAATQHRIGWDGLVACGPLSIPWLNRSVPSLQVGH